MNTKPKLRERALYLFSPKRGNDAYNKRLRREWQSDQQEATGKNTGQGARMSYGSHGASQTLNSLVGWILEAGNAEDNIDLYSSTLRQRARDLFEGGGLARSGPETLTTSVVGWGIQPKPKIDGEFLGMTDEAREEAEQLILREFKLWAENTMCDAARQQNFYGLQQLAFLSMLMSGDVFALFSMKENRRTPYQTTIRLLEADRICNPDSSGGSESTDTDGGGRIIDGVEIDKDGAVVRYHVASRSPIATNDSREIEWVAIEAYGSDTGYPNILQIMTHERPEQHRGIPFVSAEIELIKQFTRYMNAELAGKVVSAMLTLFITSKDDDGKAGMEDAVNEDEKVTNDELKLELAPGAIYDLPPGMDVTTVDPKRSDTQFESFVNTCITVIASSMGIPKEVLIKKYESNYTAARAALLDFWRTVRVYRTRFNSSFNHPIYEQWLSEAVAIGRIDAPGFFDDPAVRQAWCGCVWMGASMGHVDPLKEVNAAETRIRNNITTEEQEASEYNGNDWAANVRQRKKEIAVRAEMGGESQETAPETLPGQSTPGRIRGGGREIMPGNREFFQLRSTTPRMAAGSDEAELMLYGEIVPDYSKWYKENYPEDKSAADFDKAVKQIKQNGARRLNLRINSPGGIVTQAVAMRAILSGAGFERINMRIEGMCASAATIIASLPGAHVEITPGSEYMIHNPWNIIIGTAADMEHEAEHLRALEATSLGFYINRTGQEEEQVKAWMDAETWFNAEDAVKYGFVDAVAQENGGTDLAAACVTGREMAVMRKLYKAIPEQIEVRQDGGKVEAGGVFIEREDGQEIILPPEYTKKVHDLIQQLVSNEAPVAGVSTEIHHHEEENKSMENQENMSTEIKAINVDQLRAENPALYDSIRQSAISEERQRIEEIDDLTMPGYETMAEKAKADGISAMEFHRQIVQAQKQKGASFIENRKRETTPEKPVHGGDASDNNANAQATSDAMAKELAEMADGMSVNVKGMY